MGKSDVEKLKGNFTIISSDRYVVAYGKKLCVYTLTGSLVFSRSDIRNIFKATFLKGDALLVDAGRCYFLISLVDGSDIWRIPQSKREFNSAHFAISPCGIIAYDFYLLNGSYYLQKIDLNNAQIEEYPMDNELRTAKDIQCESDGEPAILRSHYSEISGRRVSENGIVYPIREPFGNGSSYYWKNKWQFEGSRIVYGFWKSTESVITNDLNIFHHATGGIQNLLKNESQWSPTELAPLSLNTDRSGRFLVLNYSRYNVVIDINMQCVVAQYVGQYTQGCIIGDEFWISSDSGILRKSFPLMEEIPEMKYVFWNNI